jgi:hypothetical protein
MINEVELTSSANCKHLDQSCHNRNPCKICDSRVAPARPPYHSLSEDHEEEQTVPEAEKYVRKDVLSKPENLTPDCGLIQELRRSCAWLIIYT